MLGNDHQRPNLASMAPSLPHPFAAAAGVHRALRAPSPCGTAGPTSGTASRRREAEVSCSRSWHFPAATSAVADARNAVAAMVEETHPALAEDTRLLVSELATNAVVHASSDFEVTTHVDAHSVRVEVADNSPALPTVREPSLEATSGRGFHIVAALASGWGVRHSACGKVVWIELSAAAR